jgi:hypothetical protein
LVLLGVLGCGGKAPEPASPQVAMQETVNGFLAAVKANDLNRMGQLWGTDKGPAAGTMEATELMQRLTVIQKYLAHSGYRVVEGPISSPGNDRLRTFRVELQRNNCVQVVPLDLVFTRNGTWVVFDVHLEAAGNPAVGCPPAGTRP